MQHTPYRKALGLALGLILLAGLSLLATGCKQPAPPEPPPASTSTAPVTPAPETPAATPSDSEAKKVTTADSTGAYDQAKGTVIKMRTTKGLIVLELFDKQAPITAGSFLLLVKDGFYDGVSFHRVVPNFVIQGGDPTGTGAGGPGFTIPDELSPELKHERGMLSMAKTAMPDTGGSQFFIVTGGPETVSHLNMKHAVFGKVLEGMDVVDKIQQGDKMESVTVLKESPDAEAAMAAAKKARVKE